MSHARPLMVTPCSRHDQQRFRVNLGISMMSCTITQGVHSQGLSRNGRRRRSISGGKPFLFRSDIHEKEK